MNVPQLILHKLSNLTYSKRGEPIVSCFCNSLQLTNCPHVNQSAMLCLIADLCIGCPTRKSYLDAYSRTPKGNRWARVRND
jgi:hypothetical protein